ncbi:hypothetical protein [Methylobacterium nonmethylotrophicum]|uniref:Uncharacterized protein n=1 Tax=Methylobacterium nonmethylotrophicum TaxID=1141884 RepID=A0A4Z0NTJ9_9HYPH|nr:hypothetical protein [Methylobacterium nonmethylotrophicum]TGE00740.1 hypothetical protein EU555_08340 [Methylobacterium nonmethylotrophicum]
MRLSQHRAVQEAARSDQAEINRGNAVRLIREAARNPAEPERIMLPTRSAGDLRRRRLAAIRETGHGRRTQFLARRRRSTERPTRRGVTGQTGPALGGPDTTPSGSPIGEQAVLDW